MEIKTQNDFSSLMHGMNIFHRCQKIDLKKYLHETNKFYKYEKNREVGEKIMIYELQSLVSIVYTNLLL